jgi:hypothetical protein
MSKFKKHIAGIIFSLASSMPLAAQANSLESALFVTRTQSPEWSVVSFGGAVAEKLYGLIEMQGEISCNPISGSITCNLWVNRKGDFRNAAPEGAEQSDLGTTLPGTIDFVGMDPEDSSLALIRVRSSALTGLLSRPIGHDLYCRGDICQFTIDNRGVIDPRPFVE